MIGYLVDIRINCGLYEEAGQGAGRGPGGPPHFATAITVRPE